LNTHGVHSGRIQRVRNLPDTVWIAAKNSVFHGLLKPIPRHSSLPWWKGTGAVSWFVGHAALTGGAAPCAVLRRRLIARERDWSGIDFDLAMAFGPRILLA
jgi:hypothetical protein